MHSLWRVREGLSDGCDYDVLRPIEGTCGKKTKEHDGGIVEET